jgi:hypothetical protein
MAVAAGKEPELLVNTTEDTSAPATAVGQDQVAFLIGPAKRTIGVASTSNGRIVRRMVFDKGDIDSMASSPDGKTLYFGAGGSIWSIPVTGGTPARIRAGDHVAVAPSGQYLIVEIIENPEIRFIRVPLRDGLPSGPEQDLRRSGDIRPSGYITPNAVGKDGRILISLGSMVMESPAGVLDPVTGRYSPVLDPPHVDFHAVGWGPDGSVIGFGLEMHSRMWKFSPEDQR